MLAAIGVVAGMPFLSASCSLLVDTSDLSGGVAGVDDATTDRVANGADANGQPDGDGGAETDAGDESQVDAGARKSSCGALLFGRPLPLFNGDFELGCANGWAVYAGSATEETASPSSGAIACRVCTGGAGSDGFLIYATVSQPVVPGESYEVVACVRAVPGADGGVAAYAELSALGDGARGSAIALGNTYMPVRGGWTVATANASFSAAVRVSPAIGAQCFLVDDVSVARVRDASAD